LGRPRTRALHDRPSATEGRRSHARTDHRDHAGERPMGETTDQLKADIEYRRERMSGTVDAIEERVVPGRIIRRRTDAARGWMGQARTRVMGPPQRIKAEVGALP